MDRILRTVAYIAVVAVATPAYAQVIAPVGTKVSLSTTAELSSKTAEKGAKITFLVSSDVVVGDQVIIKKGTSALGTIEDAKKSGMFGSAGFLVITIDSVPAVDGQYISLMMAYNDTAASPPPSASVSGNGMGGQAKAQMKEKLDQVKNQVLSQVPGAAVVGQAKEVFSRFRRGDDMVYPINTDMVATTAYQVAVKTGASGSAAAPAQNTTPTDTTQASDISPATIAFFEAAQASDMAFAAYVANQGSTPEIRAFGRQVIADDSALRAQLRTLVQANNMTVAPVVVGEEQDRLNSILREVRKDREKYKDKDQQEQGDRFDKVLLTQMYSLEEGFINGIPEGDETPIEKLLSKTAMVWQEHMIQGAKFLVAVPPTPAP